MTTTPTIVNPEAQFFRQLHRFLNNPNPDLKRAATLFAQLNGDRVADTRKWYWPGSHPGKWDTLRATFHRSLTAAEILQVSGSIAYALQIYMGKEELSLPTVESAGPNKTVLTYFYDSTRARRRGRNLTRGLEVATRFIAEGTPMRKTDRQGPGTAGTRLSTGIGPVGVEFAVK